MSRIDDVAAHMEKAIKQKPKATGSVIMSTMALSLVSIAEEFQKMNRHLEKIEARLDTIARSIPK